MELDQLEDLGQLRDAYYKAKVNIKANSSYAVNLVNHGPLCWFHLVTWLWFLGLFATPVCWYFYGWRVGAGLAALIFLMIKHSRWYAKKRVINLALHNEDLLFPLLRKRMLVIKDKMTGEEIEW